MLFIPQEKVKKTLKRLHEESMERSRQHTLKKRQAYLEAKKNNNVDEFFEDLKNGKYDYV